MRPSLGLVSLSVSGFTTEGASYWSTETVLVDERRCLSAAAEIFVILGPDTYLAIDMPDGTKWKVKTTPELQGATSAMLAGRMPYVRAA